MKTAIALAAVILMTSAAYAGNNCRSHCGVSVLAPGVSVQVSPQFVPQLIVPQVRLQQSLRLQQTFTPLVVPQVVVPQFSFRGAELGIPGLELGIPGFELGAGVNERETIRLRQGLRGRREIELRGNVRAIDRGRFGRIRRIEFFD